jgi:hypothetical protein
MEGISQPTPDADLSVFVRVAVDEHLAAVQHIRSRLCAGRSIDLGGRRVLALESVAAADRFRAKMSSALRWTEQGTHTST